MSNQLVILMVGVPTRLVETDQRLNRMPCATTLLNFSRTVNQDHVIVAKQRQVVFGYIATFIMNVPGCVKTLLALIHKTARKRSEHTFRECTHLHFIFPVKLIGRLIFKVRNFPQAIQFPIN